MTVTALPSAAQFRINPAVALICVFGMIVAWYGPFDIGVRVGSFGQPLLRMAIVGTMIAAGMFCATRSGLHIGTCGTERPIIVGLTAALGAAIYVCVVDGFLFRTMLPPHHLHAFQTVSLSTRLTYYFMRAFQENVIYRLFVLSGVLYLLLVFRGGKAVPTWMIVATIIGVQAINVGLNVVLPEPLSVSMLGCDVVRYVAPGALWGWLYWRFGFATTEIAHVSCHAFLQPALAILL